MSVVGLSGSRKSLSIFPMLASSTSFDTPLEKLPLHRLSATLQANGRKVGSGFCTPPGL